MLEVLWQNDKHTKILIRISDYQDLFCYTYGSKNKGLFSKNDDFQIFR